jgi:hypothetical protein
MKRIHITIVPLMKKLWPALFLLLPFSGFTQDTTIIEDSTIEVVEEPDPKSYFTPIDTGGWEKVAGRKVPDSIIRRFQNDVAFWYANRALPKKKVDEPSVFLRVVQQPWFRNLMWLIICLAFGAVLVWFLATSNVRLFRKSPETIENFTESITAENIFSIDYEKEIEKASRQGAYRLATRLHYLQLLSIMASRALIRYKQDATNSDYLFQLSGTDYYKPFFVLTRHFEYIWYGQFEISAAGYAAVQNDFVSFKKELAS